MTAGVGRTVAWSCGLALSIVLSRQLLAPDGLALFWPPAGIAVLWLLSRRSRGARTRDTVLLGVVTTASLVAIGTDPVRTIGFVVANVVQPLAYLACWRRHHGGLPSALHRAAPRSARDVLALVTCAAVAGAAGAVVGTLTAWAGGADPSWPVATGWLVRNGSSIAILTLVVTTAAAATRDRRRAAGPTAASSRRSELVLAVVVSALVTLWVFADPAHRPTAFASFVPALWIALRFSPVVTAAHGLAQTLLALSLTVTGRGPFGGAASMAENAQLAQGYVALTVVTACLISVSGAERARLVRAARAASERAEESAAAARARAALLEEVTASLQDGLLVVTRDGSVVLANDAAGDGPRLATPDRMHVEASSALEGVTRLDGRPFAPEERLSRRALAGERVPPTDVLVTHSDSGTRRVFSVSASPVDPTDDPADRLAVMIARDVTAERAALDELRAFAGVVAHDLKNPLGAIGSWVEVLEDQLAERGDAGGEAALTARRIGRTTERVLQLVDELLQYARSGADELVVQRVPLLHVAQEALSFLGAAAVDLVVVECPPDLEVDADPVLLRQVLVNLFGNALKYATSERPDVRLRAATLGDRVVVDVVDDGIGIPDDERDRVFEGFYRSTRTADVAGTGLGLAICARTVRRHGGGISATDAGPDGGTRITFWLPLVSSTAPEEAPSRPVLDEKPPLPLATSTTATDGTPEAPTPA